MDGSWIRRSSLENNICWSFETIEEAVQYIGGDEVLPQQQQTERPSNSRDRQAEKRKRNDSDSEETDSEDEPQPQEPVEVEERPRIVLTIRKLALVDQGPGAASSKPPKKVARKPASSLKCFQCKEGMSDMDNKSKNLVDCGEHKVQKY